MVYPYKSNYSRTFLSIFWGCFMPVKLFILGLPGSGKSAAAHYIETFAIVTGWIPEHLKDYPILLAMFEEDMKRGSGRFRLTEDHGYKGFDALDFNAIEDALRELESKVSQWNAQVNNEKSLLIIEFSRNNYVRSLDIFRSHFSEHTYFLFLEAEIDVCKQRILERVENQRTPDDHYVSEEIFQKYYEMDPQNYAALVVPQLKKRYGIPDQNICVITNDQDNSKEHFDEEVKIFVT